MTKTTSRTQVEIHYVRCEGDAHEPVWDLAREGSDLVHNPGIIAVRKIVAQVEEGVVSRREAITKIGNRLGCAPVQAWVLLQHMCPTPPRIDQLRLIAEATNQGLVTVSDFHEAIFFEMGLEGTLGQMFGYDLQQQVADASNEARKAAKAAEQDARAAVKH